MIVFDDVFRARLLDLLVWRRDVRRFRAEALPPETLERLTHIGCLAPSVGLSQPWRFAIVDDPARRHAISPTCSRIATRRRSRRIREIVLFAMPSLGWQRSRRRPLKTPGLGSPRGSLPSGYDLSRPACGRLS